MLVGRRQLVGVHRREHHLDDETAARLRVRGECRAVRPRDRANGWTARVRRAPSSAVWRNRWNGSKRRSS